LKTNESGLDRIIRVAVGLMLVFLYTSGIANNGLAFVCFALGGILIITGGIGFSPIYALFKIKTKNKK
jgi:hypothetical protein